MSYENFPVAVVDNGGQWTHREYRVLNYLGCRAEIVSNVTPIDKLERFKALVLSGGAPQIETESEALGLTSEYIDSNKWPILGICVGHQYMANHFGGKAGPAEIPEFGSSLLTLIDEGWILSGFPKEFNVFRQTLQDMKRTYVLHTGYISIPSACRYVSSCIMFSKPL